jgi:AAA ATPase domain
MSKILLEYFRTAYANMELSPLITPKEVASFRVEYGTEVIEQLEHLVEDNPSGSGKIIFSGHRGCGKSTLLAEFYRQMDDRYFTVFLSISDLIEMSDINHINILFAIAVQLMTAAEKQQIPIKKLIQESFYNWFATKTKTKIDELGASGSVGFNLFKMITGKLKADATIREEIKQEFLHKVSDFVATINEIAAVVEDGANKPILVVIDDLDKLDLGVVRQVYQEHIKALFLPNFRMILTTPISALRDVSLSATVETETTIKLCLCQ